MELYGVKIKVGNYFTLPRLDRFVRKFGSLIKTGETSEQRVEISGSLEDFIEYFEEEFNIAIQMEVTGMLKGMRGLSKEDRLVIASRIRVWRENYETK